MNRRSKYNNRKTEIDGITFDSHAEANRYLVLRDMEAQGIITELSVHTRWPVLDDFVDCNGKRIRGIVYEDDFSYARNGRRVVEDVKGVRTAVFRLKAKLFQKRYPHILFLVTEVK